VGTSRIVAGAVHPIVSPGYEPVVYLCQNILTINTGYYPKQQQPVGFINVDAMCCEVGTGIFFYQYYVQGIHALKDLRNTGSFASLTAK
jgi:hypothetical protein